jgi:EmrB/QacA subfamily drug resistance transporter
MSAEVSGKAEAAAGAAAVSVSLLVPATIACGNFMTGLDQNVVVTALPGIGESLGESPGRLGLVVTAYLMSLIVAMPASGWLAERIGLRRGYCCALLLFAVASALCAAASDFWTLVLSRTAQGLGGGLLGTLGQVVILQSFPRHKTLKINTYMTLASQTGPMVGPLLGGALTTYLSWRWIFLINVPIALIAGLLAARFFPNPPRGTGMPFDFPGFLLIGGGMSLLVLGMDSLTGAGDWTVLAELAGAAVLLAAAALYCMRASYPLLDLRLLKISTFRIAMVTGGGLDTIGIASVMFLLPLLLQVGFGMSAVQSGSLTFLVAFGSITLRAFLPLILKTFGFRRTLLFNTPVMAALVAGFALMQPDTPYWLLAGYIFVFGAFRSTQWGSTGNLSYSDIPPEQLGRFSALYFVAWQTAVTISVGLASALLAFVAAPASHADADDFRIVFLIEGLITICAIIAYSRLKPTDGAHVSGNAVPAVLE